MKLLFDENLSPSLVARLAGIFPGSQHVHDLGLGVPTTKPLSFARSSGHAIVTKDRDFLLQCAALGHPPRVVLVRIGNCPVDLMERVLRANAGRLARFEADPVTSYIVLER